VSAISGHCDFVELPLLSSAGLRMACLNCRSLLSIADEVFDLMTRNQVDDLQSLKHGWIPP